MTAGTTAVCPNPSSGVSGTAERLVRVVRLSSSSAALCLVVVIAAFLLLTAGRAGAVPDTGAQIVFSETVAGNADIYLRDAVPTRRVRLTTHPRPDVLPAWSPDGRRVAYVRLSPNGGSVVRLLDLEDGSDKHLRAERSAVGRPAFIPGGDGVLVSTAAGLLEVPLDDPRAARVIGSPNDERADPAPDPLSSEIVVSRPRNGGRGLAVIDEQGVLVRWLTDGSAVDTLPAWVPDGSAIYFARRAIGQVQDRDQVYRIERGGGQGGPMAITSPQTFNYATSPAVSPDGERLVVEAAQGGIGERMYVMNADGKGIRFLALGADTAWRPEGWYLLGGARAATRWIESLRFNANDAKGAIRVHQNPGLPPVPVGGTPATGTWFQVVPYRASLAVEGLLRSPDAIAPDRLAIAEGWIDWYLDHLNTDVPVSDPDYGVVYDHWYRANGGGESLEPGGGGARHDAADSYSATLLEAAWAYIEEGGDPDFLAGERMERLRIVADVILRLQQPDGLTWARSGPDGSGEPGRTKFLMDNAEVYRGLLAMADLELVVAGDQQAAGQYLAAAADVRDGINSELLDPATGLYRIAKFENDAFQNADTSAWFLGTAHLAWPHLMGVTAPSDPAVAVQMAAVNGFVSMGGEQWWTGIVDATGMSWPSIGYAALLVGDAANRDRARAQVEFLIEREFPTVVTGPPDATPTPTYPFVADDAGWLVQTLSVLSSQRP